MIGLEDVVHDSLSRTVRDHIERQIDDEQVDVACGIRNR